jgi:hypothetical protein
LHFPFDNLREENRGFLGLADIALHILIYKSARRSMLSTRGNVR